jgi:aminopeptidase N
VEFTLRYHTVPERGLYFVPRRHVIWSQGEATETRNWIPTYDAANDKTTWEFLVTADTGLKVLSNGRLVEVKPAGAGKQVWHWAQETPASTYLYSVAVGPFAVLHDEWRGIPVEYWVDPDTVEAGWRTFGETPSMIELYSRLTGVNYPWAKYDQSVIADFTYGGMENVSATTQTDLVLHAAGEEPEQNGRRLVAHELAHQWFGDYITTANWAHAWLNEGLTTYMESVHDEKTRGWNDAELIWWGQQQEAMAGDQNGERPLVWGRYPGDDPIILFFSGHVYQKGAQVAHQLRRLLGDSLFWAGMHRFLTDNALRPVETPDYAVAFEKTCHCDLDWFFDQWAYGIGYPRLQVTRQWDSTAKALRLTVEQTQKIDSLHPLFRFPATVRVTTRGTIVRQEVTVSKQRETFSIPLPAPPLSFRFDEGGWLLGTIKTDQTAAELAQLARHDLDVSARNWALCALDSMPDSAAVQARRFIVLNEHVAALRREALRQLAGDSARESRDVARSALRDPDSQVRAQALTTLATLERDSLKPVAQTMYQADPNTWVRIAALQVLASDSSAEALPLIVQATAVTEPTPLRGAAADLLKGYRGRESADALAKLTDPSEPRDLRKVALDALTEQGDSTRAAELAARYLADYDPIFAATAAGALAKVGGASGRAKLVAEERKETRVTVRAAIVRALGSE